METQKRLPNTISYESPSGRGETFGNKNGTWSRSTASLGLATSFVIRIGDGGWVSALAARTIKFGQAADAQRFPTARAAWAQLAAEMVPDCLVRHAQVLQMWNVLPVAAADLHRVFGGRS